MEVSKDQVIQFAREQIGESIIDLDQQERFNWQAWHKCGEFGILGLPIPKEYGCDQNLM